MGIEAKQPNRYCTTNKQTNNNTIQYNVRFETTTIQQYKTTIQYDVLKQCNNNTTTTLTSHCL
jgi:hypothetical protein